MIVVLSDCKVSEEIKDLPNTIVYELDQLDIHRCIGCYSCWVKTPGQCIFRDAANKITADIAACEHVVIISRILYGGYAPLMKKMVERLLPCQQAFLRIHHGEFHHVQRDVKDKYALILGYDAKGQHELLEALLDRNQYNMSYHGYKVKTIEDHQPSTLWKEVVKYANSVSA
ncbi:MAG: NAD(P)H-dependent oxidoreductase [Erysipelotrichaceae bacterium]